MFCFVKERSRMISCKQEGEAASSREKPQAAGRSLKQQGEAASSRENLQAAGRSCKEKGEATSVSPLDLAMQG